MGDTAPLVRSLCAQCTRRNHSYKRKSKSNEFGTALRGQILSVLRVRTSGWTSATIPPQFALTALAVTIPTGKVKNESRMKSASFATVKVLMYCLNLPFGWTSVPSPPQFAFAALAITTPVKNKLILIDAIDSQIVHVPTFGWTCVQTYCDLLLQEAIHIQSMSIKSPDSFPDLSENSRKLHFCETRVSAQSISTGWNAGGLFSFFSSAINVVIDIFLNGKYLSSHPLTMFEAKGICLK